MYPFYLGIDLHLKNTYVVLVDQEGNSMDERRLRTTDLVEYVETRVPRQTYAVMEATRNWPYFYDELEQRLDRVELAHPKELKAISTAAVKTDRIDARVLAQLARMNYLPIAYAAPQVVRDLRQYTRLEWVTRHSSWKVKCMVDVPLLLLMYGITQDFLMELLVQNSLI